MPFNKKITINIGGGLGNQFFQYAVARRLSIKYNAKIVSYDQVSRRGTLNKIYNSFGCKEHIRVRLTLSQKIKHLKFKWGGGFKCLTRKEREKVQEDII